MIGMTLCSGIGAPEMAAPWVDWRLASEIEPFPRAVLEQRFGYRKPDDHHQGDPLLWGDMTGINPDLLRQRGVPLPDLVVAGTPCQAFSVAGLRKGTADARGNLTLKFVEIMHELVAARPDGKLAVLWENVPGVLSDKGNAFGCFLGGLVGAVDALQPPGDGSWPGEGMVQGPRARAAWSVLDAQWFGVAQRRRRVFVVIDFGNCVDPAAVLLEPDRLRGDSPPRREAGQVAPTIPSRSTGGGGLGTDFDCDGGLIAHDVAPTLNAHFGDKMGLENQHINGGCGHFVAHALRGEGFDASEDGTGRGTPIVPVAFDCKGTEVQHDASGVSPPLRSMGHHQSHQNAGGHAAIAIQERAVSDNPDAGPGGAGYRTDDAAYTLEARQVPQAVAFAQNQRDEVRTMEVSGAQSAESGMKQQTYIAAPWAVRRLTPTECHRLQGLPDGHCNITHRNKPAADGPQYKALGNSMAVPVVKWILDRIRISNQQMGTDS